MLCVAKNNSEYVEVTPVEVVQPTLQEKTVTITENGTTEVVADSGYDGLAKVSVEANVQDNSLLNVIKGMNSYNTTNYPFELTEDMWDENSTQICQFKYNNNKNITKVDIPNNITMINQNAFYNCQNLLSVKMPSALTNIYYSAFVGCKSLEIVDFRGRTLSTIPTISNWAVFNEAPKTLKFIIPDSLYDSWIAETNWAALCAKNEYSFVKASEYVEA